MLIVDRRMPFLQKRCDNLSSQMTDVTIIVDRRVAQDVRDQPERRFNYFEEDEGLLHAPRSMEEQVGAEDINSA
ncbi:hypothetical protein BMS3Abin01_01296 [bacterium BMS3Abin01]|nr:hypothetical protein BMS3Abin01_01296 [bacterium BMS3Abin01]